MFPCETVPLFYLPTPPPPPCSTQHHPILPNTSPKPPHRISLHLLLPTPHLLLPSSPPRSPSHLPDIEVRDPRGEAVSEAYYRVDSTVGLQCVVMPVPPSRPVLWSRSGRPVTTMPERGISESPEACLSFPHRNPHARQRDLASHAPLHHKATKHNTKKRSFQEAASFLWRSLPE
ncbi:hypothetical protein O3P69_001197 [Scylla paramamosain]|uniref:Ig-like domain-containing protein n=1 Tax=Scylla paramamosain TaxID=85552 RepID=A0AAW0UP52_SCYPA